MASSIKITTTINAPVERTWEVLSNPAYLSRWLSGFIGMELQEGNAGEAGSTSTLKFTDRGRQYEVVEKILYVEPCQQYTFQMTAEQFESINDIRLIPLGRRTELIQAVQITPGNIFWKLMMPVIKRVFKKSMMSDMRRLKNLVEESVDQRLYEN